MVNRYKVAVIAGDGIGREVVPEGLRVLQAASERFGFTLDLEEFDYANVDYYLKHGQMMPDDWFEQLRGFDAIFFGAVGWPELVPDHISLWGSLIQFRRHFDQYVNLRPCACCPASPDHSPAANPATSTSTWCGRTPRASTPASAARSSRTPHVRP